MLERHAKTSPRSPAKWDQILNELSRAVQNATTAYDQYAGDVSGSGRNTDAAEQLRNRVVESNKLVQKLRNRTAMVAQSARVAQELAKRSNLIALNATIASNGMTKTDLLASEIEALSLKSDELQRQIVLAGEALNSEIAGIEKELASVAELAPSLGKSLSSSVLINHRLCEQIGKIGELEEQLRSIAEETQLENDRMTGLLEKVSDVSLAAAMIRETETGVQRFSGLLDGLRDSVADLKLTSTATLSTPVDAVRPEPQPEPIANGFQTMNGHQAAPITDTRSGFETATGFEARSGFETLIDFDARIGES
jgi:hypothetical protein